MPAKRTSRAPIIFIRAYRDYDGALAELEVVRSTMPNAPRIFELTGFIARRRGAHEEGVRNLQRAVNWIRATSLRFSSSRSATSFCVAIPSSIATIDRALSIKPDDPETKAARGLAFLDWKADTRPLHQTIDEIRAKRPGSGQKCRRCVVLLRFGRTRRRRGGDGADGTWRRRRLATTKPSSALRSAAACLRA